MDPKSLGSGGGQGRLDGVVAIDELADHRHAAALHVSAHW